MKKILIFTAAIAPFLLSGGCSNGEGGSLFLDRIASFNAQEGGEIVAEETEERSYQEILLDKIPPGISPDEEFPVSEQFQNGCFAFGVKHIVTYKYGEDLDLNDIEKIIEKPRSDLWTAEHIRNFLAETSLGLAWYEESETFFEFLRKGEPVLIQYWYPLRDGRQIGHFVAAYSYDDEGIWISESIAGKNTRLPFSDIFSSDGQILEFPFAVVAERGNGE